MNTDQAELRRSIALLEEQQRKMGLDFSARIAELRRRLGEPPSVSVTGSGAMGVGEATVAGEGGVAVRGNVYGILSTISLFNPRWYNVPTKIST